MIFSAEIGRILEIDKIGVHARFQVLATADVDQFSLLKHPHFLEVRSKFEPYPCAKFTTKIEGLYFLGAPSKTHVFDGSNVSWVPQTVKGETIFGLTVQL